jgi:predicted metal-binding protein
MVTLLVCALCKAAEPDFIPADCSGGEFLIDQIQLQLEAQGLATVIDLQPVRCMAACSRACNAAVTAPGKLTFILNALSPQADAPALLEFCQQYAACPDGRVPYGQRSTTIKAATAYVLPPMAQSLEPGLVAL